MSLVWVSAGDLSGDRHAASLVRELSVLRPGLRYAGLAGPAMRKAGVEVLCDQSELAVGGLVELAGSAGRIARTWRRLSAALEREDPQLFILVDSGGFHLPFARRARRRSRAPILYYVAPQVWAWRSGRIRKLAQRIDRLATIWPFEPEIYTGTGLRVDYVGHPLVEPLSRLRAELSRDEACRRLGLDPGRAWLALLPGSRRNELRAHLPRMLASAALLQCRRPNLGVVVAVAPSLGADEARRVALRPERAASPLPAPLHWIENRSLEVLRAATLVLAKPGTGTVEAALLDRPMVVIGRAHPLTAALVRRLVRTPYFAMPNLVAGRAVVPELLQEAATAEGVAAALDALFAGPAREAQRAGLAQVRAVLAEGGGARRAAEIAAEMLDGKT